LTNGKSYIGSSINLRYRFYKYYSIQCLLSDNCMPICRALLKYGYSKFSVEILEYCKVEDTLIREKHYLDLYQPKYNISLDPTASFAGRKHSEETKKIMSDAKKINNSGRFKTGENHPNYGQKVEGSGKPSQAIEVTDIKNNTTIYYDSMSEAARALNLSNYQAISNYIKNNQQKPYKGQYTFKKLVIN